jgi:hypothetical protein
MHYNRPTLTVAERVNALVAHGVKGVDTCPDGINNGDPRRSNGAYEVDE